MTDLPEDLDLDGGWRGQLLLTPTQQPKPLLANALHALRCAHVWRGVLAYDEFALTTMAMKPPPWLKHQDNTWEPRTWTDQDDTLACEWLHRQLIGVPLTVAATAVEAIAKDSSFHPIRDYLDGLEWDGVKRVEGFAAKYLGADETAYHHAVSRCLFIAAVARVMQPGCKFDHMVILEGPQDLGKSSAVDLMFSPWFSDDMTELGSKDASMQVRVAWGIEIAELASMTRGEIERVKAFITRKIDRFRPRYGRRVISAPRQSVFVGSTNADNYLKDETGGRRFWPIKCREIDLAAIRRDRDQIWAEAMVFYRKGTPWWLTETGDRADAREEQEGRRVTDAWEHLIAEHIKARTDTSVAEVLQHALFLDKAKWDQQAQNRVARCLTALGWGRYRGPRPLREWRYHPVDPVNPGATDSDWDQ